MIEIKGKVFLGDIQSLRGIFIKEEDLQEDIAGSQRCKNSPIMCVRCKKNDFYICKHYSDWICFCADAKCMTNDSDASKTIYRQEKARQNEEEYSKKHGKR